MSEIEKCSICKDIEKFDFLKADISLHEIIITEENIQYIYDNGLKGIKCLKCYNFWRREGRFLKNR